MATTFTLKKKQKIFMMYEYTRDANGKLVRGQALAEGAAGGGSVSSVLSNTQFQAAAERGQAARQAAHQAKSEALKPVQKEIDKIAGKARIQGYNAGKNAATVNKQVLQNTWNKMGTMGKAGAIAGGLALGGLAVKGLVGGGKKEKTYSIKRITK